jgi:hypothetical protein
VRRNGGQEESRDSSRARKGQTHAARLAQSIMRPSVPNGG